MTGPDGGPPRPIIGIKVYGTACVFALYSAFVVMVSEGVTAKAAKIALAVLFVLSIANVICHLLSFLLGVERRPYPLLVASLSCATIVACFVFVAS